MSAIETHIEKSFIVNVNLNKMVCLLPSHTKEPAASSLGDCFTKLIWNSFYNIPLSLLESDQEL